MSRYFGTHGQIPCFKHIVKNGLCEQNPPCNCRYEQKIYHPEDSGGFERLAINNRNNRKNIERLHFRECGFFVGRECRKAAYTVNSIIFRMFLQIALSDPATDAASFGDKTMRGNSGVMYVQANGTKTYSRLMSTVRIANGGSAAGNPLGGLCGNGWYGFTEMLEPDRILNDIAKAGLISKIWDGVTADSANCSVVFEYDETGNMKVSDFTNEELATGANMVPNHKYYQVRSVPNTKGMADGAMTAVINIYVKMTFKDGTTVNNVDHTGGHAVYKFSHPVYRGMCLQDGMFSQMQGCHYVNYCTEEGKYVTYFKCAENVDDMKKIVCDEIDKQDTGNVVI